MRVIYSSQGKDAREEVSNGRKRRVSQCISSFYSVKLGNYARLILLKKLEFRSCRVPCFCLVMKIDAKVAFLAFCVFTLFIYFPES